MARRPTSTAHRRDNSRFWIRLYESCIPLLDTFNNHLAGRNLARLAVQGSVPAASSLAASLARQQSETLPSYFQPLLESAPPGPACNMFWQQWSTSRSPALKRLLAEWQQPATQPVELRVLSLLALDENQTKIEKCGPTAAPVLTGLLQDSDAQLCARARQVLDHLKQQTLIDALCTVWCTTRDPRVESILTTCKYQPAHPPEVVVLCALKFNRPEQVLHASADQIPALVSALQDKDPQISRQAELCLPQLQNPAAIDAFCKLWVETRSPILAQMMVNARYIAADPGPIRTLSALKNEAAGLLELFRPDEIPSLLDAAADPDEQIAACAQNALGSLRHPASQSQLCLLAVSRSDALAFKIALAAGFRPELPENHALFVFLADQWTEYDALDFDHRLMRAVYSTADAPMRQRIARHIQQTGRTQYLDVLTRLETHSTAQSYSPVESAVLIRTLSSNQEWPRLWELCFQLRPAETAQVLLALQAAGWSPPIAHEKDLFSRLLTLSTDGEFGSPKTEPAALPLAVRRAVLRIHGRVNDLTFAPSMPWLAIGTGARRVVVWNYQQGQILKSIQGFKHSVGRIAFTQDNRLICGERGRQAQPCSLYAADLERLDELGQFSASITFLEPLDRNLCLVAARDGSLVLWDTLTNQPVSRNRLTDWPRTARIAPDQKSVALLNNQIILHSLPALEPIGQIHLHRSTRKGIDASVAQCACYTPDGAALLVGQFNGQVLRVPVNRIGAYESGERVTTHRGSVVDIAFLPRRDRFVTAGADGLVHFFEYPSLIHAGKVTSPVNSRLTSLHISPDGSFLATGNNDNSLVLWDLRVQEIAGLLEKPIASFTPADLQKTAALAELVELPVGILNTLKFIKLALMRRFQYDVQVSDFVGIQPGEFDILVD